MTREEIIRRHFDRAMRLLELGPSYNPVVPQTDGWQTTLSGKSGRLPRIWRGAGQAG